MRVRSHIAARSKDIIQGLRWLPHASGESRYLPLMTRMPENQSISVARDSNRATIQTLTIAIALALMLAALWSLMHRYQGFARDGELYAFQSMARLDASISSDVYLANTSQDRYTVFSPIYATFVRSFGLRGAESLLFALCTLGFLGAAWALARRLSNSETAWLVVVMLISTVGYYGAYGIFHYSENYLTARTMAEALVVTSLAAHYYGRRGLALMVAVAAMFIHPLMALPGVLLLICLWLPIRQGVMGMGIGVFASLGIACAAVTIPAAARLVPIIDPPWLDIVRERSQFLFLEYWTLGDWEMHARPFLCLTISALVIEDDRIRKLCMAAALVGAAGLAVSFIAGAIGPVGVLLQGQAWRWFWVTGFVSVLLLAPTALRLWRDEKCGPMCATLIVAGWTFPAVHGTAVVLLALILWSLRSRIEDRTGLFLRWAAFALISVIVLWIFANSWSLITSPRVESGPDSLLVDRIRGIFGLHVSAIIFFGFFCYWIRSSRTLWVPALTAGTLAAALGSTFPGSFNQIGTVGSRAEIEEFSDWRAAIPPGSNVLIVPTQKSASFVWFTLGRPSYLSVDQSSGVVFSRATALEIRRRSDVLLPIMEPDWKILSQITQEARGKKLENLTRPLTPTSLSQICADSQLGFVVAREDVGFESIRHSHAGAWKNWNLYDCHRVRSTAPTA